MKEAEDISWLELESTWGCIRVTAKKGIVVRCELPGLSSEPGREFAFSAEHIQSVTAADSKTLKQAQHFIHSLFAGRAGSIPPFAWPSASPFTTRVWKRIAQVKAGIFITYGELARSIGRPGGARAVGRACGANPLPLFIPCHRVLPRDGSLGGFSSGLPWKRYLLDMERTHCAGRKERAQGERIGTKG